MAMPMSKVVGTAVMLIGLLLLLAFYSRGSTDDDEEIIYIDGTLDNRMSNGTLDNRMSDGTGSMIHLTGVGVFAGGRFVDEGGKIWVVVLTSNGIKLDKVTNNGDTEAVDISWNTPAEKQQRIRFSDGNRFSIIGRDGVWDKFVRV
jgi:hypothetical protein